MCAQDESSIGRLCRAGYSDRKYFPNSKNSIQFPGFYLDSNSDHQCWWENILSFRTAKRFRNPTWLSLLNNFFILFLFFVSPFFLLCFPSLYLPPRFIFIPHCLINKFDFLSLLLSSIPHLFTLIFSHSSFCSSRFPYSFFLVELPESLWQTTIYNQYLVPLPRANWIVFPLSLSFNLSDESTCFRERSITKKLLQDKRLLNTQS